MKFALVHKSQQLLPFITIENNTYYFRLDRLQYIWVSHGAHTSGFSWWKIAPYYLLWSRCERWKHLVCENFNSLTGMFSSMTDRVSSTAQVWKQSSSLKNDEWGWCGRCVKDLFFLHKKNRSAKQSILYGQQQCLQEQCHLVLHVI